LRPAGAALFGFWKTLRHIPFGEECLPVEVAEFNEITIEKGDSADAGTRRQISSGTSQCPDADDDGMCVCDDLLHTPAEVGKYVLPFVS